MFKIIISTFLTIIIMLSCSKEDTAVKTPCIDKNCKNYSSQADAQADYDLNKECRADLDADKDGIACEEPGNTVKTCSATANCGCSNKNKAECEIDPCCIWIVGTGCKCK